MVVACKNTHSNIMTTEITTEDPRTFHTVSSCVEMLDISKEKSQTRVVITSKTLCRGCGITDKKCPVWCRAFRFVVILALFCFSVVANWINCELQWDNFPWDRYFAAVGSPLDGDNAYGNTTTEEGVSPIYYANDSPRMSGVGWFTNYDISTIMALKAFCILLMILYACELFVVNIGGRYMKINTEDKAVCFLRCQFVQLLLTLSLGDFAIAIINYRLTGIGPGGSCQLSIVQSPNNLNSAQLVAMLATLSVLVKQLVISLFIIVVPLLGNTCICRWTKNIPGQFYFDFRDPKEVNENQRYRFYYTLVVFFVVLVSGYFCVGAILRIVGRPEHAKVTLHYNVHHTSDNMNEISRYSLQIATLDEVVNAGDSGLELHIPCQSLYTNSDVKDTACSPSNCTLEVTLYYNKLYNVFSSTKKAPILNDGSFWFCHNSDGDPEYVYSGHELWLSYYDTCHYTCDSFNTTVTNSDIDANQCV